MLKEVVELLASKIGVRCHGQASDDILGQCLHAVVLNLKYQAEGSLVLVSKLCVACHGFNLCWPHGVSQSISVCPTLN